MSRTEQWLDRLNEGCTPGWHRHSDGWYFLNPPPEDLDLEQVTRAMQQIADSEQRWRELRDRAKARRTHSA